MNPERIMRLLPAFALIALSACGQPEGAALLERAQGSIDSGNYRAAQIDLKNLLRVQPDNVAARLAFGRVLLAAGDAEGAVRELRRARELGAGADQVDVWLARGLVANRLFAEAIGETRPPEISDPKLRAELLNTRGDALLGLERHAEAQASFESALQLEARQVRPLLGMAAVAMATEGYAAARQHVDRALQLSPEDPSVWRSLGSLALRDRRFVEARTAFEKAGALAEKLQSDGELASALAGLTEAQMALGQAEEAEATTQRLARVAPASVPAVYLQSRAAFLRGDYDIARRGLEQLLAHDPKNSAARLLIGAVNYSQGNLGQADMYLSSVIASEPGNTFARRLLADTRLRQQKPREALAALDPALRAGDVRALSMAGQASLQLGDYDGALHYLEQSAAAKPEDAQLSMQLAAGYLAAGRRDRAVKLLESLETQGEEAYRRDLLLLLASVREGERGAALEQARRFASSYPKDSLAQSLVGAIAVEAGELEQARDYFAKAQQLAPKNAGVHLNQGRLGLLERKFDSAESHFKKALELQPNHPSVLVSLAQLAAAQGDNAAAVRWLENARKQNARALEPRIMLGNYYLAQRDFAAAQAVALEATQFAPEDPAALNVLGLALTSSGQIAAGISTLEKLSGERPDAAAYRLSLARGYLAAGRFPDALASAQRALELDPDSLPTLAFSAALLIQQNNLSEARRLLEQSKRLAPQHPATHLVEGDIALRERKFPAAAAAYQAAQRQAPSRVLAQREFMARQLGGLDAPTAPLEQWIASNPDDLVARLLLAQALQTRGAAAQAVTQYQYVIERDPRHAIALNNLAWLNLSLNEGVQARSMAERAYQLQPNLADIVDTYGWVLLQTGDEKRAVQLLRRAHELSPQAAEIRFHLAAALAAGGTVAEARGHLQAVLGSNQQFPSRRQASELLAKLGEAG